MPIITPPYDPTQPRPRDGGAQVMRGTDVTATRPQDGSTRGTPEAKNGEDLFQAARDQAITASGAATEPEQDPIEAKLLRFARDARSVADRYTSFTRKAWARSYDSFANRHFQESKYRSREFDARSKLFIPKTRSAVRKGMAAHAASLFSTVDALAITAGNESEANSRASAALMQEVVNYRTDRTSGKNAIKWFLTCMGAVQDAMITSIVVSKQYWMLETQPTKVEQPIFGDQIDPATGQPIPIGTEMVDSHKVNTDRPEVALIPPDQVIIDAGADWRSPAQSAAFMCLLWPMKIEEIRTRENSPQDPWLHLEDAVLNSNAVDRNASQGNAKSVRTAREGGVDRYDPTNQASDLQTIWVSEWYIKSGGVDWTFYSVGEQHFLSKPRPVEEVYPWARGERPIQIGYGSIESHKINPMSPVESWGQLQYEINDLSNLTMDTVKMNIAPLVKVKSGRQVDLDVLRRRGPGTNLLMSDLTDVEFEKPPGVDPGAWQQRERLNNDFDSLAGQFDQGSVMSSRSLNETVGGMKMLTGAANALGEYDQRVLIETWAEPVIGQVVLLCQYYEHDETVLALCGERAELWQKFGVNEITDKLLEAQVTTRIDIGVGAGDPMQRIQKFTMAAGAAMGILKDHPQLKSGEYVVDVEAVVQECFGGAGYRDGGKRFIKKGEPKKDPNADLAAQELKSKIEQNRSAAALNLAKAQIEPHDAMLRTLELISDITGQRFDQQEQQTERVQGGQERMIDRVAGHQQAQADHGLKRDQMKGDQAIKRQGLQAKGGAAGAKSGKGNAPAAPTGDGAGGDQIAQLAQLLQGPRSQDIQLIRGRDGSIMWVKMGDIVAQVVRDAGGKIASLKVIHGGGPQQQPPAGPALPPPFVGRPQQPQPALPPPGGM